MTLQFLDLNQRKGPLSHSDDRQRSRRMLDSQLTSRSESCMRIINPLVLLALLVLLVAQSASTEAADLNGAWAIDSSTCGDIFTKKNNKLAFKQDADLHAGGI